MPAAVPMLVCHLPRLRARLAWLVARVVAAALLAGAARAQVPPPPTGPTFSSKELAAQAPAPQGQFAYKAQLILYVKARRVDVLQRHFEEMATEMKAGRLSDRTMNRVLTMVSAVEEADAGLFDAWAETFPESYVGALARGYFNMHRAWKARGNKWARLTHASEFEEMHRWLALVRRDAQLALQRESACSLCYALLIQMSKPLSLHKEAQQWFAQGLAANRDTVALPVAYYDALDQRWGGSTDLQAALAAKLRLGGHLPGARRLEAQLLADRIDHWSWSTSEHARAGLAAAQASLAIEDTYDARFAVAYALQKLGRHAEAVEAFTRIVEDFDSPAKVFETRAYSYSKLNRWPEALRDLRIAYDQFLSSWAFETLVRLSVGNSGWDYRTSPADYREICAEGALRGLPIAMTCLGGMHFFGTGGIAKDAVQARHWFRRAADAGDPQGMMDLAQMSLNGQGGPVDRDAAIRLWIAAAQRDHKPAQEKLDNELGFFERVKHIHWPELEQRSRGWLRWAIWVFELVFSK